MILILQALSWADCNNWDGVFSGSHPILAQTKSVTLLLEETVELSLVEEDCFESSDCSWSLSNEIGVLDSELGVSNLYTAPSTVEDCADASSVLSVSCPTDEEDVTDRVEIIISCGEIDPDNPTFWKPSGGGCNSPTYAYLLIFPLLSLWRKRERV